MIKDYKAFTSKGYKISFLLVEPLVFMCSMLVASIFRSLVFMVITGVFLMLFEMLQDYFSIGCICKKNDMGMEYIKTSYRGKRLIQNTLIVDSLIKVIKPVIVMVVGTAPYVIYEGTLPFGSILVNLMIMLIIALDISFISIASVNITRYIDTFNIYTLSTMPIIAVGILLLVPLSAIPYILSLMIMIVLVVVAIWLTYIHMNDKLEKSYTDLE